MSMHCRPFRAVNSLANSLHSQAGITNRRHFSLRHIEAANLHCTQDPLHVASIHSNLVTYGLVKAQLHFQDEKSQYLEQLILQLHRNHNHGLPINHSSSRGWFWDVRPNPDEQSLISSAKIARPSFQARSETMMSFPWHTDCSYESSTPRYFGLHVLQPDRCNGGVLSLLAVEHIIKALSPTARKILSKPYFQIAVPPEFIKNDKETSITGSLVNEAPSGNSARPNWRLRFREDIVTPLKPEAVSALAELKSILHGPRVPKEIIHLTPQDLPRGSVILIDNRRWLHARNEVKDPGRHLRRVRWDAVPFASDGDS